MPIWAIGGLIKTRLTARKFRAAISAVAQKVNATGSSYFFDGLCGNVAPATKYFVSWTPEFRQLELHNHIARESPKAA